MKLLARTALFGSTLALLIAGVASAHSAVMTCGTIVITNTPTNEPAYIYNGSHATQGTLVSGPDQNGSYTVDAGSYEVIWPQWDTNKDWTDLTVVGCPTPTPTQTPSPTPTVTPTPSPSPSATPSPSPSPRASLPVSTPPATDTLPPPSMRVDIHDNAWAVMLLYLGVFISFMAMSWRFIRRHIKNSHGQGLAEYALVLALVAVIVIITLIFLGSQVSGILQSVGDSIGG